MPYSYNIIFPMKALKHPNYNSDEQCGYEFPAQIKISFLEIVPNNFQNVISGLRTGAIIFGGGSVHVSNKSVQQRNRSVT